MAYALGGHRGGSDWQAARRRPGPGAQVDHAGGSKSRAADGRGAHPRAADDDAGERALIDAARRGSAAALDQLIERLADYLWRELGGRPKPRNLGPSHGLSDLVQDTLLRVREKFDQFQRDSFADFKQWARAILFRRRQEWARNYRTRSRDDIRRRLGLALDARLNRHGVRGVQEEALERRQETDRAFAAFERLKIHERNIIRLRVLEGLRFHEIAALTGMSAEGARTAYRRASARLKRLFHADA